MTTPKIIKLGKGKAEQDSENAVFGNSNQPTPLITFKEKCPDIFHARQYKHPIYCNCKGTGQIEKKVYRLSDFEKCQCSCHKEKLNFGICCDKIGYILPFKNYEIKKVSELNLTFEQLYEINPEEDDKVVIIGE